jgi:hypothetical protein
MRPKLVAVQKVGCAVPVHREPPVHMRLRQSGGPIYNMRRRIGGAW